MVYIKKSVFSEIQNESNSTNFNDLLDLEPKSNRSEEKINFEEIFNYEKLIPTPIKREVKILFHIFQLN